MKPKPILVLTEHFFPSTSATGQLISDLVNGLSQRGLSLKILTSTTYNHLDTHDVIRFNSLNSNSNIITGKLFSGINFFAKSFIWLFLHHKKYDTVLIVSNPPFIGLIGLLISGLLNKKYIYLFQDIFPRSAVIAGILPARGPIVYLWRYLMRLVIQKSQTCIVLSHSMQSRCLKDFGTSSNISVIPNWSVVESTSEDYSTKPIQRRDTLRIQYSGNFGRMHDILTILEAARLLASENVIFQFIGGGNKSSHVKAYINQYNHSNVFLEPYAPLSQLRSSIHRCDLSIVSLLSGTEDTVAPSKFYGIIACNRPVILIGNKSSELASIIDANDIGLVIDSGDPLALAEEVKSLISDPTKILRISKNAFNLYQRFYQRKYGIDRYYAAMTEAAQ